MIAVAATVLFVWLAVARDKGWAWILAAIFGFQAAQNVFDGGGSLFFPVLVIAAGVVLLSRGHLSRQAIIAILLVLAIVGIAADDHPHEIASKEVKTADTTVATEEVAPERVQLPELKGRRMVVTANDTNVSVSRSVNRRATAAPDAEFEVFERDGIVLVELSDGGAALDLRVPSETRLTVDTNSGDVSAVVSGFGLEVDTNSGEVEIDLDGKHPVTAETLAGKIDAEGMDDEDPSPKMLVTSGAGMPVTINTVAGDIRIEQD